MEFCHIRGCIHTCVVESYTTVSRLYFYTTINTPGPNIVCKDQLNRARVSVFSGLMSAISISQRKCKRLSNMDHVLGSLAVGIKKGTFTVFSFSFFQRRYRLYSAQWCSSQMVNF